MFQCTRRPEPTQPPTPKAVTKNIKLHLYVIQVNNNILDDEDQGDVIGEYTPDVLVTEFVSMPLFVTTYQDVIPHICLTNWAYNFLQMKGEKQLVEKLLQTEINLLRSIRDGSALMQHMEDFYYVTLLEVS